MHGQSTAPPPPPDRREPPKHLSAPRDRLPSLRDGDRTLTGLGAPPARAQVDPGEVRTDTLLAELAARAARAEVEALRAELATKPAPVVASPSQRPPTRAQWQSAGFRVVVSLGAVLTALATFLGVRTTTTLEPKVDRQATKQEEQATKTVSVEDRLLALEKYNRSHANWQHCMNAERDSAIERGTGHRVESAHDDVSWVEQSAPKPVPRVLWKTAPWSVSKDQSGCGAEPAPPPTPPPPALP